MSDWPVYLVSGLEKDSLLLVQDGNHGEYRPRKNEFTDKGVAFIRAADLGQSAVQFGKAEKINNLAFERIRKGIGKDLDTILSTKGTVGKLALVPEGSPDYVCSPQTTFWRSLDHEFLDPQFLYFELQSRHFIDQISSRKGETDMADYLSLTAQRGLSLRIPDKKIQLEVVKVLSAIDNKIELNRQTNQTLEQIAQAIFKSWFVDFEPVKAKAQVRASVAEGRTRGSDQNTPLPKNFDVESAVERAAMSAISGKSLEELEQLSVDDDAHGSANVAGGRMPGATQQQLKTTAALFPDALVESELGEVPEGWEIKKLKEVCRVINGRAYKNTEFKDEGTPIVRIQNLSKRGKTVYSDIELPEDKLIYKEDFVYAWSATFGPYIWRGPKSIYHYHIWKMDVNEEIISRYFLYLSMFRKTEQMKSAGTGSIFTHLTKVMMENQEILIGTHDLNKLFKNLLDSYFKKITALEIEIESLETTRDVLLPKLLSGELKTNNAA